MKDKTLYKIAIECGIVMIICVIFIISYAYDITSVFCESQGYLYNFNSKNCYKINDNIIQEREIQCLNDGCSWKGSS